MYDRKIKRLYSDSDVEKLKVDIKPGHTIVKYTTNKFRELLSENNTISGLGAFSNSQAIQQIDVGIKTIYCSGRQVAAERNTTGDMYPDLNLYTSNSVSDVVKSLNKGLYRQYIETKDEKYLAPIIADGDAGFGGILNTYELTKNMIESGAAGIHLEDQFSGYKRCGHLGGKIIIPVKEFIEKINAARLATDICEVNTVIIARLDSYSAQLITNNYGEIDKEFITTQDQSSGFFNIEGGLNYTIKRAKAIAPYADIIWRETSTPDLEEARIFSEELKKDFPDLLLAYNCSPSFNWKGFFENDEEIKNFREDLYDIGYKYQFITLAGWHSMNYSMFSLAKNYHKKGMLGYTDLQELEKDSIKDGYRAFKHQQFVGNDFYDKITKLIKKSDKQCSLSGSTEEQQF